MSRIAALKPKQPAPRISLPPKPCLDSLPDCFRCCYVFCSRSTPQPLKQRLRDADVDLGVKVAVFGVGHIATSNLWINVTAPPN